MLDQFGGAHNILKNSYAAMLIEIDAQKVRLENHFELNKENIKKLYQKIQPIIEQVKDSYDFFTVLCPPTIRKELVY